MENIEYLQYLLLYQILDNNMNIGFNRSHIVIFII